MSEIGTIVESFGKPLSAHRFFAAPERRKPVHDRLRVDDALLGLLGVPAGELASVREERRGVENVFDRWLRSGKTMLEFVAILRVCQDAALADTLARFDGRVQTLCDSLDAPDAELPSQRDKVAALVAGARRW